ncbi:MAG: sarcosine oxidase subunit gamma [Hyphomicrobium sp.]
MADTPLLARSAFPDIAKAHSDGLSIHELEGLAIVAIGVAPEGFSDVDAALSKTYGVSLPGPGRRNSFAGLALIWAGPGSWLAIADRVDGFDLEREFKQNLGPRASVTDASDGRAILRLSGARARAVLARGVPIDLHPRAFNVDDAAITHAAHIGVAIWKIDDTPTFDLAVSRSYAASFAHWLIDAAASEVAAPL